MKSARGTYHTVYPTRILDTRNGTGAPAAKLVAGGSVDVSVATFGGVPPNGVVAVVLNVTEPTASGHVTVWPTGVARPNASSLKFVPGWTGANSVTVGVGANGKVSLYNSGGTTHLIADVVGYYLDSSLNPSTGPGGTYFPDIPRRRLDTRTWPFGKLTPGSSVQLLTNFFTDNERIKAWVVNITATDSEGLGYVTAWNGDGSPPNASKPQPRAGQDGAEFRHRAFPALLGAPAGNPWLADDRNLHQQHHASDCGHVRAVRHRNLPRWSSAGALTPQPGLPTAASP